MGNPNPNTSGLKPFTGADDPRRGHKQKGSIHLSTHIQNILNDDDFTWFIQQEPKANKIEFKGKPVKAIIMVAIYRAMLGDKDAREWLAKYGYGNKLTIETSDPVEETLKKLGLKDAGKDTGTEEKTS